MSDAELIAFTAICAMEEDVDAARDYVNVLLRPDEGTFTQR